MFDKFGEMDTFGEINELAENLFNEGDTASVSYTHLTLPTKLEV